MNRVILARYSEPLEWIKLIPNDFEVVIYNKGEPITSPEIIQRATRIIDRPNVGRESETYLNHMLNETEDNDDFTVYAQGDPFEHSPDFINLLHTWKHWQDLQPMSWQWLEDKMVPPTTLLAEYQRGLFGRPRVRVERFSLLTWGPIDFVDQGAWGMGNVYRVIHGGLPDGTNIAAHFLRLAKLDELAANADQHSIGVFSYGAIFAVRNKRVAAISPEALSTMLKYTVSGVTVYGYILERLWLHLLGEDFVLPKISPPPL
jgi:hypothetical protein